MAYKMYLDGVLMPITPSKVTVKINNQNKTMTLINGEEINVLNQAGLSDVSFELLLPQVSYPFTNGKAQSADVYLSLLERLKTSKKPFQWILNRQRPNGAKLFYTNLTVSLEDYQITDDAGEGFDIAVSVQTPIGAAEKAQALLKLYGQKTKSLTISSAFGDSRVRAGSAVMVSLNLGDMSVNTFLMVERVTHHFKQGSRFMDLTLVGGEFIA